MTLPDYEKHHHLSFDACKTHLAGEVDVTVDSVMVERIEVMQNHLEEITEAVRKAIAANHAMGFPVYQCKEGYIVAIYPDGREVKLQKAVTSEDL